MKEFDVKEAKNQISRLQHELEKNTELSAILDGICNQLSHTIKKDIPDYKWGGKIFLNVIPPSTKSMPRASRFFMNEDHFYSIVGKKLSTFLDLRKSGISPETAKKAFLFSVYLKNTTIQILLSEFIDSCLHHYTKTHHFIFKSPGNVLKLSNECQEEANYSSQPFSGGLREKLSKLNDELNYLTIDQAKALELVLIHRKLYILGAAGTGKTIFLIEAAYRALRAGQSVLILYRSFQFRKIFNELLGAVSSNLYLLPSYLVEQAHFLSGLSEIGDSDRYQDHFRRLFPSKEVVPFLPFDYLIADDVGTYRYKLEVLLYYFNGLSNRIILASSPEQVYSGLTYGVVEHEDACLALFPDEKIQIPADFYVQELKFNLRNAKSVAQYASNVYGEEIPTKVVSEGLSLKVCSNLEDLDQTLLVMCADFLKEFPPHRIKILVDPAFYNRREELRQSYLRKRNTFSFARAIDCVSFDNSFTHSDIDYSEEYLSQIANLSDHSEICIAFPNSRRFNYETLSDMPKSGQFSSFEIAMNRWVSPHIDSSSVFRDDALADPFPNLNAILIYSAPMFIGLESDVAIYIRNDVSFDQKQYSYGEKSARLRRSQHFLSMTRAKYCLVDFIVR